MTIDHAEIKLVYDGRRHVDYSYRGWIVNPVGVDSWLNDAHRDRVRRGQAVGKKATRWIRRGAAHELGVTVARMSNHEMLLFESAIGHGDLDGA